MASIDKKGPVTTVESIRPDTATSANPSKDDLERAGRRDVSSWWQFLNTDVDAKEATGPLTLFCFMTGYLDVVCFSAIFVWCGFQTGNFAQLAIALARLWENNDGFRDTTFHKADQQALCSLIAFNAGAFIGRLGDKIGPHKRIWLMGGMFIQILFTMAAAIAFWKSGQPSLALERELPAWTNAKTFVGLAFMSASLGVQGIQGKRFNSQFGTTIVLTTIWVELMTDASLFKIRKRVATRDHKIMGAGALFLGAFVARAILFKVGTGGTLGIACGFRAIIGLSWLFVPNKPVQRR